MEENLQNIYDKLANLGSKGSYEQFVDYFNASDENKRAVYDKLAANGSKGSYEQFLEYAGVGQQQPASRVDVSDVEQAEQPQIPTVTMEQVENEPASPYGDLTAENFIAAQQRGKELSEQRKRIQSALDTDTEMEPLTASQRKEYESQLRGLDEEMRGVSSFIDEWNKTEGAKAYYEQQKRTVDDVSARIDQMQADRNRERVRKNVAEDEKKSWWLRMAEGLASAENPITEEVVEAITDTDNNDLRAARNEVRNAKNQLRLEEMRQNGEQRGLGFVRGLETSNYYELMPAVGMADAMSILQLSKDIKDGKELTDSQKLLKEAMEARAGVDFAYQDNNTLWERIGQSAPEQLMFTAQFVVGAGVTGATKVGEKVAAKSAEKAAKRLAKKEATSAARNFVATRVVPELEGMAVSSAIQTFANPLSVAGMVEDFEKRYAGDIYYDKDGNLHVFDNDRSAGQAAYQAIASAWIENFTEYAGGNITKSAKLLDSKMFDLAGKFDNVMKTVGAGKIQDVFRIPQQLGRLTQIGSAPEEFLEEELGSVMNALMATDAQRGESYGQAFKNTISNSFAGEQQLETFLSCAITSMLLGGGGNAVNGVRNAGLRKSVNQDVEQSKALLGKVRGIDIEGLDNMIENGRVSDISAHLKEQSDANNWNKDEQGAAVSYVLNRSRQIGVKHNDDTAIEAEQAEYRRQAEDMVNRWDGQNIYNVTYTDRNGETQEGTIVNGRVHYNTNEDGTYTFDPYMSSGMLAIRRADGSVEQVAGRNVTALNNVATIEEQLGSQNQTIDQLMRAEFEQDGMLPTIESVWGGNLVPNVTQFQNGRYTYLGQDDNGLYAFANNDKKTSKDNPIVYLTERQLVEYGLSLNLENAQANGDTEAAQKAQDDIDFLKRLDEITADAGAKGQWDVVKAYAQNNVQFDANGDIIPDGSNEQATAAYLLAISEGSFENAIASVDQTIAALGTPQQTEVTDNAADNAAMNNAAATVDADKARQIDFYTNVRNRLTEMQQGKEEADQEEAEQVVANTPVSQMEVGQQFPVEWRGQQAMATVMGKDADGRSVVTVRDMDGEDIEAGIDDMSDAEWEGVRVQPQEATSPEQVPQQAAQQAPEQVEPQQQEEVPQTAPQQEAPQQHPLDDFIAKHGDNAENKLGVTIDAINKEIASLAKDLEKAEKDLTNMPEPYDEKTQKAQDKQEERIAKLRTELDEKRNILAPYTAMQEELDRRKEVRQGRENGVTDALVKFTERLNSMLHPKREDTQDMEPQTLEEFIASKLRRKGLARTAVKTINKKTKKMVNGWKYTNPVESLDYDSFKQETGLSDTEMKNFNDPIQPFFTKEGGVTFGDFVHSIWEDRGEPGVREDISDSEVRDAVIEFFRSGVSSLKDINDYIENHRRDEQAEQEAIANDMIAQQNGYESGEAMENDLIAQASARADELLGSDTLSDEDVAAFDAELSQRLDNLVPSIEETTEETEPATQETTVESTEDEDFIQPTDDEEAPFSVTGKSNEQIASEYQKQLDEAETESERAAVIQEYLDTIGTEPVVVMTSDNYESLLLLNGVKTRDILTIRDGFEYCKSNNLKFNAFKVGNKVYMFAEDQDSIEDARTNYVHERQHILTTGTKNGLSLLNRIKGLASKDELEGYVERLSGSDFYTKRYGRSPKAHEIYADEFISMAMEHAYNGADLDAELGGLGIPEDLINEIKSLDNEQRTDESLAAARRHSPVGESRQGDNGQNVGNRGSRPEEVGGQRPRSTGRSREAAERRESVKSGEIGNEQRKSDGLSKARRGGGRNLHVDNNAERGSGHDGQNQGRRPGEVEEQGLRPSYRGNEKTGSGEVSGILPIDKQTPKNTTIDEVLYSIKVNHNSPTLIKKADGSFVDPETGERLGFDHRFMGTGEGGQAHGWGSYFSINDIRSYGGSPDYIYNSLYKGKVFPKSDLSRFAQSFINRYDGNIDAARSEIERLLNFYKEKGLTYINDYGEHIPFDEARKAIEQLGNKEDFDIAQRHHYSVEIPDDTGKNYIEERKKPSVEDLRRVVDVMTDEEKSAIEPAVRFEKVGDNVEVKTIDDLVGTLNNYIENDVLKDLYDVALFIENDGYRSDPKEASRLLRDAGFTGIHYDGMRDGECYVIFDENDAKIVDHVRFSISVVPKENLGKDLFASEKNTNFAPKNKKDNGNVSDRSSQNQLGEGNESVEQPREDRRPERSEENGEDARRVEEIAGRSQKEIEQWAKENGRWIPSSNQDKLGTPSPSGDENNNYLNKDGYIYKINNLMHSKGSVKNLFDRIKIHNELFPETQYEFVGYTGFDNGNVYPVFRQRYVYAKRFATKQEIEDYMKSLGFESTGEEADFTNGTIFIKDLHPRNVLVGKDGEIYVIDADIRSADDLRFSTNGTHVINNGKSLVGIHNIGAEKLRKVMKNGGLANPSAAVIDIDKQEHKGYGDVSLIMPSSLVDSRTGRNTGTYAGDAYTPMYPSVEYREGKNTGKILKDLVKGLPKELGWAIQRGIGEYMDGNRSRSGLEYMFLKEKGQEMPIVKNERRYPDISTEQIDKRLGVEESATRGHSGELYAAYEKLEGDDLVDFNMWFEAYGDKEKIQQRKDLMERNAKVKELLTEQFGEHMGYGKFDTTWYNVLRDERDAGKENIPRTLEDAAMKIDELGLRNEFEDWKQKTIDGLGYEEVIFDGYTPSGYRRYVPNTVENASRIMNKKEKTNWLSDAGTHATKAMLLDKFNTLNDIRKNRGLLESDQEVINQAYEEASDAWSELGSELSDMQKIDDNRFINHDIALNRLQEAMMQRNPAAYLNKEYKYNLDEEFNDRIKAVKQQIKSLPSKYFETKFRRPVYLNEFAAAVVPNDLPQDLKERLQQSGLPLFEYDPNKEGDRRAVTLEATEGDGIRFSVKNSEKNADDNQLSLFLQNNTGEYETQDGQTIGFTSLLGAATEASAVRGRDNVQRGDDILQYHLRRLEPGETCHVERRYQKSKMFDFTGSEKIESADDVAYIFNKLEDAAVENSFVVLVKDGKPTIIHTGVGSYGSTYLSIANALVAYKNINPDAVWFVHNHPSGSITSSQPDRDSSKRCEKVFGKKYKGGIIIDTTSGKYGVFDSKSDTASGSTRNTPKNETDIDVYGFSKQVFDKDWNPETAFRARTHQDIATFVSSHRLGEHDKMSLLVLNNNLNVVGNVFLPYESIGESDIKKLTDDVLYYTNQMAGTQAVIYGSFTADDVRDIKKLANNIANAEGRLTDVISTNSEYTGLRSARLMGAIKEDVQEIKEDDARFSVGGQQRNAIADEFNRRTGANMEDVGTYTRIKESLIRDWFDGLHPLEQMQQLVEKALGRKLRDSEKAYELATQTTSVSAAMIDEEEKKHLIPILNKATELIRKMMNNDRLSREEAYRRLSNYMLAKHGLERNKWFHDQALQSDPNAEEEDMSGLTGLAESLGENPDDYKAVAERIVKEFEDEYDSQEIDDYWDEMRGFTNRLLEISYESGMIDKDTYEGLKKRHKFYVPLRGFGEETAGDMFDYIAQMPHFQDVLKKAKGRKSMASDPLSNLYNMLQSAIVIGNQNKVMQKLYNLAVNAKSDLLRTKYTWYVYNDVTDTWEEKHPDIPKDATADEIDAIVKQFDSDMQQAKANGKAKRNLNKLDLGKKVLPYQAKEHEMVAYIDGKKVVMQVVGNPLVAQALNKANGSQLGIFAETMQGITRFMSMINTSLSPAFMLTNSARDIGFALFSAMVTGGFKKTGQMAAWMATSGWVIPRLMVTGKLDAGLVKALGKQNAAQIEQWWNEFTQNGGETGFTRTLSAEKARGQIDDMIRHMLNGSKDGESRLRKSTIKLVESAGRWSEDISRFAAYCWSRAQGNSVMESVNEAKNVTVNFNVKGGGRLAAACRAVYSFFNAALQGIGRMARLAKENPKAFAACLTACMLQGAVLPWLNMLMFGLLGGDDDDWKKYEMLTEYTANKNLVLYVGNHKFLKIPYSQELAPFAAMGNIFFRQQMGWNKGESVASQIGKMFLDLAPVSIGESKTFMGKAIKTVTPTALMPFVELRMNEDFTGSPIQKDNQWNKYARGWERAYEGKTSKWLVDASKWLDDKTGFDIKPAVAEHMFSGVLGGIGRSGDKLLRYFSNGFQLQDAPFIRTMMFDSKQQGYVGAVQREYGRNAYDVLDKVKHDVENMDAMEFAKFSQTEEFEIANLVSIYKTGKDIAGNDKGIVGIDKMEKQYKKDAGMSDGSEEYREHLEAMKAAITEQKMELLDEIEQIKYEHAGDLRKRIIERVNEVEKQSKAKAK